MLLQRCVVTLLCCECCVVTCCVVTLLCYDSVVLWHCCVVTVLCCDTVVLCCDTVVLWLLCCIVTLLCCDSVVLWHCCVVTVLCCDTVIANERCVVNSWYKKISKGQHQRRCRQLTTKGCSTLTDNSERQVFDVVRRNIYINIFILCVRASRETAIKIRKSHTQQFEWAFLYV